MREEDTAGMPSFDTLYRTLGLPPGASPAAAKDAYRKLTAGAEFAFLEALIPGNGQLHNANLIDYRVPVFEDLPETFVTVLLEDANAPGAYGAKGGERAVCSAPHLPLGMPLHGKRCVRQVEDSHGTRLNPRNLEGQDHAKEKTEENT
jgi:hypothetical protein